MERLNHFLQYGSDYQIFPISEASEKQVSLLGNLSAYLIYWINHDNNFQIHKDKLTSYHYDNFLLYVSLEWFPP